ncbi:MAG: Sec-independent protein translocase protein TatB [Parvularculaceae bacterium]
MSLMPQFGFFELMLVAAVALVVVGPKDLPRLMRGAGRLAADARRLASEFAGAFDQMAREAEVEEMRREIDNLKRDNVFAEAKKSVDDAVAPVGEALREEAAEPRDALARPDPKAPRPKADDGASDDAVDPDALERDAAEPGVAEPGAKRPQADAAGSAHG